MTKPTRTIAADKDSVRAFQNEAWDSDNKPMQCLAIHHMDFEHERARYIEKLERVQRNVEDELKRMKGGQPTGSNCLGLLQSSGFEVDRLAGELSVRVKTLNDLGRALGIWFENTHSEWDNNKHRDEQETDE